MASSQSDSIDAEYATGIVGLCCNVAGTVAFLYDATITTGEEVRCFWGRKVTGAAILFWLNKYMNAMFLVWLFVTDFKISDEAEVSRARYLVWCKFYSHPSLDSCDRSAKGTAVVNYLIYLVQAAFIALRVYALQKSLIICAMAFILALAPLATNFQANFAFGLWGGNVALFGCTQFYNTTFDIARDSSQHHQTFHILVLVNSLHLAFTLLSSASIGDTGSILSSRDSLTNLDGGSVIFERVVGSLGASIAPSDYLVQDNHWNTGEDEHAQTEEIELNETSKE
ncbi:hypothetical protein BD311DRAFT_742501 [Dichomitus squalens]|uniref:DUF6533 domain-containing protein n=1 Tax=Dichomitus squalens TaxID=114155 RepID=A0A4Q9M872_9APHY|nr:hypothetical protein BD311DRAFT_742501 [Dichomitus squalens]